MAQVPTAQGFATSKLAFKFDEAEIGVYEMPLIKQQVVWLTPVNTVE